MDALFGDVKRSAALEALVREQVQSSGPMPFARFMDIVLYHPTLGYYSSRPEATTRRGDFLTSPECHPAFGWMLARYCHGVGDDLGLSALTVLEQGAGTGSLADSFTRHWKETFPDSPLRYVIVEPHSGARDRLAHRLGRRVELVGTISGAGRYSGVYLSNELPDAFPVHRVCRRGTELTEIVVELRGGRLAEGEAPAPAAVIDYVEAVGLELPDGAEIEANLALEPWISGVASALERGHVVTIDYGYGASEIARFPRGTLLAHYRHSANEDFLERIGRQDLTAHVCWTALEHFGAEAGLTTVERTSQRDFLTRLGWKDIALQRMAEGAGEAELDALDRLGREEDGLGKLGVLIQSKG